MKLDKDYSVSNDGTCWILEKHEETKKISEKTSKRIISSDKWYYPSLKQALKKYIDMSLTKCDSVLGVLKRLDELEEQINNIKKQ